MSTRSFFSRMADHYAPGASIPGKVTFDLKRDGIRLAGIIFSEEEDLVSLDLIIVHADHRGRGIAGSILESICATADETGVDLALSVVVAPHFDEVRLTGWYQSAGFEVRPELCFGDDIVFVREARRYPEFEI